MSATEVKLAKGVPNGLYDDDGKLLDDIWTYDSGGDSLLVVLFDKSSAEPKKVESVCADDRYSRLLGFSKSDAEGAILEKIGAASSTDIAANGLSKYISYKAYNTAFEIEKGRVKTLCITSKGEMTFADHWDGFIPDKR